MIKKSYSTSIFGDVRLETRFVQMLSIFSGCIKQSIPISHQVWSAVKGTYRFFDNQVVTPCVLIAYHLSKIKAVWAAEGCPKRILQLCDYTEMDYSRKRVKAEAGPLSYPYQRGFHLYNSMMLNALGCPVGLLRQSYHVRSSQTYGTSREQSQKRPVEQKETYNWVTHFLAGQKLVEENEHLETVFIADREADFMELFHYRTNPRAHFLIRSRYNRKLSDGENNMIPTIRSWSVQGTYHVQIMDRKTRKLRTAVLAVRFGPLDVQLAKPNPMRKNLPMMPFFVVDVHEVTAGVEKNEAIHWRLMTTLPVHSFEDARTVIQYYIWRWMIERFHFLLKSGGANVEKLQLQTLHRLKNAITTFSIAAMDAFKLRYLAENSPDEPIYEVGISETEHLVLFNYLNKRLNMDVHFDPQNPPNIKQYCIYLGRIGGFFPSKKQPIPGLVILTRAREKLDILIDAYLTFQ